MFNFEIFQNFDTGVPKNIFCFYPISQETNLIVQVSLLCLNFYTLKIQFALKNKLFIKLQSLPYILLQFLVIFICVQVCQLNHTVWNPWKNVQGMLKKTRGKLQMCLNIKDAIGKRFFAFSKYTEEANKRERCNLDDVEG